VRSGIPVEHYVYEGRFAVERDSWRALPPQLTTERLYPKDDLPHPLQFRDRP